ncbi:unnamed protein product [Auanema sp. JU1783]|nr:unnamed protein product [Auanema sp. JU1783]
MFAILPNYRDKILCGCRKQRYVSPIITTATVIPKPPGPNNKKLEISQTMPMTIVPNISEQRPYPVDVNHILSPISVKE